MSQTCEVWSRSAGPELSTNACVLAGGLYERRSGAAGQPLGSYQRRAPERTVLHELVARVVGSKATIVNENIPFIQNAKQESLPLKAGISGTTYRWMMIADMLGGDKRLARPAAIAALQAADAHSFHEIAVAASGFGVDYNSSQPYANLVIPEILDEATLARIAKSVGTTMEELNGVKP